MRRKVLLMVAQSNSLSQHIVDIGKSNWTFTATRWCAIVVAVLQLLLAGLHGWIVLDLRIFGTAVTPFAIAFAAAFLVVQLTILFFAWTLESNGHGLWFLLATYLTGLAILGLIVGLSEFNFDISRLMVQPGAELPPNEIMGRDWPLALAVGSFILAQLLGILPLLLVLVVLFARDRLGAFAESGESLAPDTVKRERSL